MCVCVFVDVTILLRIPAHSFCVYIYENISFAEVVGWWVAGWLACPIEWMADCAHDADVDADGVGVVIALKQFLFIYYKLPFMSPCHLQKPRGQRAVQPCNRADHSRTLWSSVEYTIHIKFLHLRSFSKISRGRVKLFKMFNYRNFV